MSRKGGYGLTLNSYWYFSAASNALDQPAATIPTGRLDGEPTMSGLWSTQTLTDTQQQAMQAETEALPSNFRLSRKREHR
jgi:hypothetical protein